MQDVGCSMLDVGCRNVEFRYAHLPYLLTVPYLLTIPYLLSIPYIPYMCIFPLLVSRRTARGRMLDCYNATMLEY